MNGFTPTDSQLVPNSSVQCLYLSAENRLVAIRSSTKKQKQKPIAYPVPSIRGQRMFFLKTKTSWIFIVCDAHEYLTIRNLGKFVLICSKIFCFYQTEIDPMNYTTTFFFYSSIQSSWHLYQRIVVREPNGLWKILRKRVQLYKKHVFGSGKFQKNL